MAVRRIVEAEPKDEPYSMATLRAQKPISEMFKQK